MTIALSLTITTIITLAVLQRRLSDRKRLSNVSDAKAAAAAGAPPPPLHFTAPSLYVRVIDGVCQSCVPCLFANILPALVVCESKIVLDACWLMQPHTQTCCTSCAGAFLGGATAPNPIRYLQSCALAALALHFCSYGEPPRELGGFQQIAPGKAWDAVVRVHKGGGGGVGASK